MLTLYHRPRTRSSRFLWLFEELGAPYELQIVTTRQGDGGGEVDPANPHPHGKVPALSDDGAIVFESPAIALYLTDKFPAARLGPVVGEAKRGPYLSWLVYYGSVMEPAFMSKFLNTPVPRGTAGWVVVEEAMEFVNATLSKNLYLLGEDFSAADVLYASTFAMFGQSPMMPKHAAVEDYVKRCVSRPAYVAAQAKENAAA
jgi:glutathione S-transferase